MVDAIRSIGSARTAPISSVTPASGPSASPTPVPADAAPTGAPSTGSLAKALAASAPVDKDRVATIKRAIQTGTFPILPATIADRLLALKLEWNGREAS